jgi:hypothetical protein
MVWLDLRTICMDRDKLHRALIPDASPPTSHTSFEYDHWHTVSLVTSIVLTAGRAVNPDAQHTVAEIYHREVGNLNELNSALMLIMSGVS